MRQGYGGIQRSQRNEGGDSKCDCFAHDLSPWVGDSPHLVRAVAEHQSSRLTMVRPPGEVSPHAVHGQGVSKRERLPTAHPEEVNRQRGTGRD
jgi:hypothetical protein